MQLDLIEKDTITLLLLEINSLKKSQEKMQKSLYAKMTELERRVPKKGTFFKEDIHQLKFL